MVDDDLRAELHELVAGLRAHLEWQRECGATGLPVGASPRAAEPPARPPAAPPARRPIAVAAAAPAREAAVRRTPPAARPQATTPEAAGDAALRACASLEALRGHIGDCTRCALARGRTQVVFGVGNPDADLMFVGEGPGHDEDVQGEPFVGRAGQLLTEIITKGMKLRREDVYIANVVKCRPPNNRNPEAPEIASCMPFLHRQIELVAPRVIVALGTFAAQTLLGVKTPITRMRGVWHDYRGTRVMPTFHPAYLLRTPGDKRLTWSDIKQVMAELGLPV